jgi:hypothetical protein
MTDVQGDSGLRGQAPDKLPEFALETLTVASMDNVHLVRREPDVSEERLLVER